MLNSELSPQKLVKELNDARLLNLQLRDYILELQRRFKKYTSSEHKILVNCDLLHYQLLFLRSNGEHFAKIVIKNNKIVRIEAASE